MEGSVGERHHVSGMIDIDDDFIIIISNLTQLNNDRYMRVSTDGVSPRRWSHSPRLYRPPPLATCSSTCETVRGIGTVYRNLFRAATVKRENEFLFQWWQSVQHEAIRTAQIRGPCIFDG